MQASRSRVQRSVALLSLASWLTLTGCPAPVASTPVATPATPVTEPATPVTGAPTVNERCVPTPLLQLNDIPDDPSLDDGDDDTIAIFEVEGHELVGKHVEDDDAAAQGLLLWQEITTRIPANQLGDLVQFEISLDEDPVAYFNRNGNVTTQRDGLKLGFSVANFALNDPNPCAPLVPRRGTFDWSLVHEFGHLRGWVDGSWDRFEDTFPNVSGSGEGFPEDGSPTLTGDFVTSYAERADGDEDHAETWTTFVMLGDDAIPPFSETEPMAVTKVRWMSEQPGYQALRNAIRISEPGVEISVPTAAPALSERPERPRFATPTWIHGIYQEDALNGRQVQFSGDDIVISRLVDGAESERLSLKEADEQDSLSFFDLHDGSAALAFSYIEAEGGIRHNIDFFYTGPNSLDFYRETYDASTDDLVFFDPISLVRAD